MTAGEVESAAVRLHRAADVMVADPGALVRAALDLARCLAAGAIDDHSGEQQSGPLADVVAAILAGTADAPMVRDGGWSAQAGAARLVAEEPFLCSRPSVRDAVAAALRDQAWTSRSWHLDGLTARLVDAVTAPSEVCGGRRDGLSGAGVTTVACAS